MTWQMKILCSIMENKIFLYKQFEYRAYDLKDIA